MNNTALLGESLRHIKALTNHLESLTGVRYPDEESHTKDLEAAIAEQAKPQEPVWYISNGRLPQSKEDAIVTTLTSWRSFDDDIALYTSPQPREPLSDEEIDSKRYRWLRNRDINTINNGGVFAGATPENIVLNGADLDAAIDKEIEAKK